MHTKLTRKKVQSPPMPKKCYFQFSNYWARLQFIAGLLEIPTTSTGFLEAPQVDQLQQCVLDYALLHLVLMGEVSLLWINWLRVTLLWVCSWYEKYILPLPSDPQLFLIVFLVVDHLEGSIFDGQSLIQRRLWGVHNIHKTDNAAISFHAFNVHCL